MKLLYEISFISFRFAEAEVQVLNKTLPHNSYLICRYKWDYGSRENQYRATRFSTIAKWEIWFREGSESCATRFFLEPVPQLHNSWDKHIVLPQTETIWIFHHAKPQILYEISFII